MATPTKQEVTKNSPPESRKRATKRASRASGNRPGTSSKAKPSSQTGSNPGDKLSGGTRRSDQFPEEVRSGTSIDNAVNQHELETKDLRVVVTQSTIGAFDHYVVFTDKETRAEVGHGHFDREGLELILKGLSLKLPDTSDADKKQLAADKALHKHYEENARAAVGQA